MSAGAIAPAYYNELDPWCCDVLRARVEDGSLPAGDVDERDVCDVGPDDLVGYSQCHFFAGIGGFPLGLRLAGWPDDLAVWTGGFPCQGVSAAGRGKGLRDERSALWWYWFNLIDACRPPLLIIENSPQLRTRGADRVLFALEGAGYACWPLVVGAEHTGAPHKRHRTWIVADRNGGGVRGGGLGPLGAATRGLQGEGDQRQRVRPHNQPGSETPRGGPLADSEHPRPEGQRADAGQPQEPQPRHDGAPAWPARPGQPQHEWEAPRLVELPLGGSVDGLPVRLVRRENKAQLKAYGNAVVPWVVMAVARAVLSTLTMDRCGA